MTQFHICSCGGAEGICLNFYDLAPSGRYGSMTYLCKAVAQLLCGNDHTDCKLQ